MPEPVLHRLDVGTILDPDRRSGVTEIVNTTPDVVWPGALVTGRRGPNLIGQTMRQELAVAYTSARYLAQGCAWTRDRRPVSSFDHQADGIATAVGRVEYFEVELTSKASDRYPVDPATSRRP